MSAWINIEVSPEDPEILAIDNLEHSLGKLSEDIKKVRELITRFELCHFKVHTHYDYVIQSITALKPTIDMESIGSHHPRHGKRGIKKDTTGRSNLGQQYIDALKTWLGSSPLESKNEVNQKTTEWLGMRNNEKEHLVTMLIDRLLYRNLEEYLHTAKLEGLTFQVLATDICNYNFPDNLEKVIQSIGKLKPLKDFHGCGTFNPATKSFLYEKFKELSLWLTAKPSETGTIFGPRDSVKVWLVACFAKTIKEQIHIKNPITVPSNS